MYYNKTIFLEDNNFAFLLMKQLQDASTVSIENCLDTHKRKHIRKVSPTFTINSKFYAHLHEQTCSHTANRKREVIQESYTLKVTAESKFSFMK